MQTNISLKGKWETIKDFLNFRDEDNKHSHRGATVTHRVNEAIKSSLVKLSPALDFVNSPILVSKERSAPRARTLVPITPEKLTIGFAVNPTLVLIPA